MSTTPEAGTRVAPASFAQERAWLSSQLTGNAPVYHVADLFAVHATVSEAQLRSALATVVARHEPLRTGFALVDGDLVQVVHERAPATVPRLDLRDRPETTAWEHCRAIQRRLLEEPFDRYGLPLWRAVLVRLDEDEWAIAFAAHHAVADAVSLFNLRAELIELCASAEQGREAALPELTIGYTDYAVGERRRLTGRRLAELRDHWRQRLGDLPATSGLPTDRPRPANRHYAGAEWRAELPGEVRAALTRAAAEADTTVFAFLLAAYAVVVARWRGSADVVIGVPVSGRGRPELMPLIGTFVNMVVVRLDVPDDLTFRVIAGRVAAAVRDAWAHQEMPYQQLVADLAGSRDAGAPPLFQLGFNLAAGPDDGPPSRTAEDDLMLEVGSRTVRVEYDTQLFHPDTARALLRDYLAVLAAVSADDSVPAGRLLPAAGTRARVSAAPRPPAPYVAPRTAAERLVADVWAAVLPGRTIGALDDFFALGGHSFLALRVIAALNRDGGVDLPIAAFFNDTTVAGVAGEVERRRPDETQGKASDG